MRHGFRPMVYPFSVRVKNKVGLQGNPLKDATRRGFATMQKNGVPLQGTSAGPGHGTIKMTKEYFGNDVAWAGEVRPSAHRESARNASPGPDSTSLVS